MDSTQKFSYEAPRTEIVELRNEGIVCQSGGLHNYKRQTEEDW